MDCRSPSWLCQWRSLVSPCQAITRKDCVNDTLFVSRDPPLPVWLSAFMTIVRWHFSFAIPGRSTVSRKNDEIVDSICLPKVTRIGSVKRLRSLEEINNNRNG